MGDGGNTQESRPWEITGEKIVLLDNRPITEQELSKIRQNKTVRIIEVSPGVYKTLQRIQG